MSQRALSPALVGRHEELSRLEDGLLLEPNVVSAGERLVTSVLAL